MSRLSIFDPEFFDRDGVPVRFFPLANVHVSGDRGFVCLVPGLYWAAAQLAAGDAEIPFREPTAVMIAAVTLEHMVNLALALHYLGTPEAAVGPYQHAMECSLRQRMCDVPKLRSSGILELNPRHLMVRQLHRLIDVRNNLLHRLENPKDWYRSAPPADNTSGARNPQWTSDWMKIKAADARKHLRAVRVYYDEVVGSDVPELAHSQLLRPTSTGAA